MHARAFTLGTDVVFRAGAYQPTTTPGRRLLAHELTHVIQQTDAAAPMMVQRQEQPEAYAVPPLEDPVVTLCHRPFQAVQNHVRQSDEDRGRLRDLFGNMARHCFLWLHSRDIDRTIPTEPYDKNPYSLTYDNTTGGCCDGGALADDVVCTHTYEIDPSCVQSVYETACDPDDYNLASFNCCSCAHQALEACGASTAPSHFPSANHGVGLPEEYGSGWKRTVLEAGERGRQWVRERGRSIRERAREGWERVRSWF